MLFPIFALLTFIVLRLKTKMKWQTLLWISIVMGIAVDFGVDYLVMLRR